MHDRRQSDRLRQVYVPACIFIGATRHVALLRDISDAGLGLECEVDCEVGTQLSVQWGSNQPIEGQVAWREGNRLGVVCRRSPILNEYGAAPRASRFDIGIPTEVYRGKRSYSGELVNLSTRGVQVRLLEEFEVGDLVTVCVGHFSFEQCSVRWAKDGAMGLALSQPIRIDVVREIVRMSQVALNAAA